jgi:hypothetical protein
VMCTYVTCSWMKNVQSSVQRYYLHMLVAFCCSAVCSIIIHLFSYCCYYKVFVTCEVYIEAVPWFRQLVTGLSPWRPGFTPGSVHVGLMVDKVALGQVFSEIHNWFPLSVSFHWGSISLSGEWTVGLLVAAVQRHSLTSSAWTNLHQMRTSMMFLGPLIMQYVTPRPHTLPVFT